MADVFVSYARADRSRVEPLVRILEARSISVWWDPGILPGHEFHSLIEEQLACAKCVLVAWSKAAVLSTWVLGEAEEGRQRRILVPFLLDDCRAPIPFRPIHTADLRGWDGGIDYPALAQLLSGIDRCIAPLVRLLPQAPGAVAGPQDTEAKQWETAEPALSRPTVLPRAAMRSQSRVHDRQAARDGRDFVLLSRGGGTIREWRLEEGRTALAGEVVLAYTGDLAENEIAPITASLVRVLATPGMSVRSGDVLGIMRRLARKS